MLLFGDGYPLAKDLVSVARYGQGGRTSSKNHMKKNYIPLLGMRKVHGDLQRLNK